LIRARRGRILESEEDFMLRRFARLELKDGRRCYAELVGGGAQLLDRAPWLGGTPTGERLDGMDDEARGSAARRLAPVEPSKIVCVGRNYRAHAAELGNEVPEEPLLFFKPVSSLLDPDGVLELPPTRLSVRVEHEVELAVVVGRRLKRATAAEAASAIFGFTVLGDVTARDLQRKDKQWTRAKGMDGFCPVGPVVVQGLEVSRLSIRCWVNGELRQDGTTADMVFSCAELLAFTSDSMTLEPGDLLATGTPSGVGPIGPESEVVLAIDGVGQLPFRAIAAAASSG
jgi:2-keto-4-pentenoate hydratase/2-oxohepta-3-ene-1,7-dioic acid hydratase in catechol pathway